MTTEARLRELLAAATPGPPWIRKWESLVVHGITGDGVLERQENIDLATAAVNALPKLLTVVEAARAYLAVDGSGIGDPDPRWRAPFDAMQLGEARPALRAALAALDEGGAA